ncbi:Uncharacterised protein [Mycobacteroides abscessus subsp. massiliense]|nr:Uncharacterised protein [Mycobacteroides abscessus subsp. massiliense]
MTARARILDFSACDIKTYRHHRCERKHRSEAAFIKCALGHQIAWVVGAGQYATISWCNGRHHRNHYVTVVLAESLGDARKAMAAIDTTGCGGRCQRKHEIVRIANER